MLSLKLMVAAVRACVCVLKRNSARSPVPTTVRTQPQMGGGVDPVCVRTADKPPRVSSHVHVVSHRREAGPLIHTHDASAPRGEP